MSEFGLDLRYSERAVSLDWTSDTVNVHVDV